MLIVDSFPFLPISKKWLGIPPVWHLFTSRLQEREALRRAACVKDFDYVWRAGAACRGPREESRGLGTSFALNQLRPCAVHSAEPDTCHLLDSLAGSPLPDEKRCWGLSEWLILMTHVSKTFLCLWTKITLTKWGEYWTRAEHLYSSSGSTTYCLADPRASPILLASFLHL